jgi:glycosyltransferase 2 family protein
MPDRPPAPAGERADPAVDQAGSAGPAPGPRAARLLRVWAVTERLLGSRAVRWGFVVLALVLCGYWLAGHWASVASALGRMGFLVVAAALLSVLAALLATLEEWRLLLAGLGSALSRRTAARIFFIGQLGKYLPGAIWPVLAVMELGTAHQVPRHRSASASMLTMLLSLFAALLMALVTLPFVARSTSYRWVFLAAPLLLVCLQPKVLNRILAWLLRLARRPSLEQPLAGRTIAAVLAWSLFSWACFGLQIWLLATRLGAPYGRTALLAAGGFAFAWSVGFVMPVPAGAGIRDVLLVALLGPVIGAGPAAATALVSRAVTTAGDLITAGAAAGFGRGIRRKPA